MTSNWIIILSTLISSFIFRSCTSIYTLCTIIDELYPFNISSSAYHYSLNDVNSTNDNCWTIHLSECYIFNISSHDQTISLKSITFKINERNVGILTNIITTNHYSAHFCTSPGLELSPFLFSASGQSDKYAIYHRQREIYSKLNLDSAVCTGFKATITFNDILGLQLPENNKKCEEIIDFESEYGFCECFGGKIMINILDNAMDSCLNICDFLNNGCSDDSSLGAIFSPNTIVGCDTAINHGLNSVTSACSDGYHICTSNQEMKYLRLNDWMCAHLTSYDTFYATLDTNKCSPHQQNVIFGCGNNENGELPIYPSHFCDIYSHSLSIVSTSDDNIWYISDNAVGQSLDTSIRKQSADRGGIMCCIDNKMMIEYIEWSKPELIVLAIFHALFIAIFVFAVVLVCERLIRYLCVRKCMQLYTKWKQKKNLNQFVRQGKFSQFRECVKESGYEKCAICLDEYLDNHTLIVLNCGHHYHSKCGRKWLLENDQCPQCLQSIADGKDLRISVDNNAVIEEIEMKEEGNNDIELISSVL